MNWYQESRGQAFIEAFRKRCKQVVLWLLLRTAWTAPSRTIIVSTHLESPRLPLSLLLASLQKFPSAPQTPANNCLADIFVLSLRKYLRPQNLQS